ncbi:MAG: DinB family protein [Chloroflexota bacterium]|nr:DinB family protein [Chloroflexota bacterium]
MTSGLLTAALVETYTMVKGQTEGLTHPDSLRVPTFGGNCANWVLGHIVVTRMNVLSLLGEQPTWTCAESQRYIPGSRPTTGSEGLEVERLIEDLHRTQEHLLPALAQLTPEVLASPAGEKTLGVELHRYALHEAFHAGQLELLRGMTGS